MPAIGRITRGIAPGTLVSETVAFVENHLPEWRDDKTRGFAEAEEDLNGQLCKFLNNRARDDFPMAFFHHEERQGDRRRVDMSALPTSQAINAKMYEHIYDPFLVMEGKRLPTPSKARHREYLTGFDKLSGGVQRFRLCLHGKGHDVAMLVAYIQRGTASAWRNTINGWIKGIGASREDTTLTWGSGDKLGRLVNGGRKRTSRCESIHDRKGSSPKIRLVHLWIWMPPKKSAKGRLTRGRSRPRSRHGGFVA